MKRVMMRFRTVLVGLAVWLACVGTTHAFSLLGRGAAGAQNALFPDWQTAVYDGLLLDYAAPGDIGGPMRVNEGYRWNIPTITYAFDQTFINYFGPDGMRAVNQAIAVFNNLPSVDQIRTDGFSFFVNGEIVPTRTTLSNPLARDIGLLDLKSATMHMIIEQLGLAESERYAWALASRDVVNLTPDPDVTNYTVINLNFDPITLRPTNMVNGVLYGYQIFEFNPVTRPDFAEALEVSSDPLATFAFQSVAGGGSVLTTLGNFSVLSSVGIIQSSAGRFYTGLTHDDVGGLRWLYHPNNFAVENLETNVVFGTPLSGSRSPWSPFFGGSNIVILTNVTFNTNLLVSEGLRGGIGKIRFQRVNFDSLVGRLFTPFTNQYMDRFITNGQVTLQPVQRVILQPDIVFTAERLGLEDGFFPRLIVRSSTANWANNDAINGRDLEVDGGPGVIQGPVTIRFTDQLPFFFNATQDFLFGSLITPSETNQIRSVIWGSFDESTVEPVIYPQYGTVNLQTLRQFGVGGGN